MLTFDLNYKKNNIMKNIKNILKLDDIKFYTKNNAANIISAAEDILFGKKKEDVKTWGSDFLQKTRKPIFLTLLNDDKELNRWSEICFKIIRDTNFGVLELIEQRVKEYGGRTLFRDMSSERDIRWTYKQVYSRMRETAAMLKGLNIENLRVALYTNNSVDGAITDLACLSYGIYNTPLNVHFNEETLAHIFKITGTNVVVTDSSHRLDKVKSASEKAGIDPIFIVTNIEAESNKNANYFLGKALKKSSLKKDSEFLKTFPKSAGPLPC